MNCSLERSLHRQSFPFGNSQCATPILYRTVIDEQVMKLQQERVAKREERSTTGNTANLLKESKSDMQDPDPFPGPVYRVLPLLRHRLIHAQDDLPVPAPRPPALRHRFFIHPMQGYGPMAQNHQRLWLALSEELQKSRRDLIGP